jgi:LmbE family N-acetylglucosaminyl deacetylase
LRILGVFAHPDDETFCAGGTFARYAAEGCEIMVVSATRGQAGQIRSPNLASRSSLAEVRHAEFRQACRALGVKHLECWDYLDGTLQQTDSAELERRIERIVESFRADIVVTFGDDGAYGHPDHVAISRATTEACARLWDPAYRAEVGSAGLRSVTPQLYHAVFPTRRLLLQDRLVRWLIAQGSDFRGDPEFVYALLLLAEEATTLHSVNDHFEVKWYPTGISIVEQGEPAAALYLLLSGRADVIRDNPTGDRSFVVRLMPGQFFGEQGIASGRPRNAHVIAAEPVTCLVFWPRQPTLFEGRGAAARPGGGTRVGTEEDLGGATTRIDCGEYFLSKLNALAAYRSQFPMRPDMLPEDIFRDMFGVEWFMSVLPHRSFESEFYPLRGRSVGVPRDQASSTSC